MVAMVAAMLFSAIRYRRISPLLWFSGVMVVVLGGLTIWLHDETFIKMKPTIYYALVAGAARRSAWRPAGRCCKRVLGSTYPGPRRGRLAQADPQLGDLLRRHGGAQRGGVAQQLDRLLDRLQAVGRDPPHLPVRRGQHADAAAPRPDASEDAVPAEPGPVE